MVNEYVWKLYLSSGGAETVDFFKRGLSGKYAKDYVDGIHKLQESYCVSEYILSQTEEMIGLVMDDLKKEPAKIADCDEYNVGQEEVYDTIDQILEETWDGVIKKYKKDNIVFDCLVNVLMADSTDYSISCRGVFVPYYFVCNFNILKLIADTFGIELPTVPNKKDYKERYLYYGEICKALYKFRKENKWTIYELCAFLYDFAPKYVGGKDSYIIEDLPEPRSAFFIGGNGKGPDSEIENDKNTVTFFQCNPDTKAGDMIVMYLRSPISAITSVWRSCSGGFVDPFFYYYRMTYICNPVKITKISHDRIKKDKILSKMPIVNKNLQGINGTELLPSEYNHILDMAKDKKIKRLTYAANISKGDCVNEREVENTKIIPLLKKMGYEENDYEQQIRIPVGNNRHMIIPDFILKPTAKRGYKTGFAIIEAKRSIPNKKTLDKTIEQARSYALELCVKYSVIVSQEGIWITSDKESYIDINYHYDWKDLKNADKYNELRKILGK